MAPCFQDPIILVSCLIILAAIVILVWAIKNLQVIRLPEEEKLPFDEDIQAEPQPNDNSGLFEAKINEIASQVNEIARLIGVMEKNSHDKKSFDDTISTLQPSPEIEKLSAKLDSLNSKIDSIASNTGSGGGGGGPGKEDMDRIESKLDSVRKLLVLLSESNKPSE
ncbi:MAG: hypothetical protein LHV68_03605 [Elusimicrobia bacterium]|nr:hypothetical protein [Candidatus Liberimonas magnetica]